MSRTPKEKLVKPVATELTNYLKDGTINPQFIENQIQFKGIDKLQDLETIFKIHFVLSDEVVEFMKKLPRRVRRIKTERQKEVIQRRGEVRGKIDWSKTIRKQASSQDRSIFTCQNPSKNYDVPENLVLKKLLSIIYFVLENELKRPIEEDYEWLKGLREEEDLINYLKNVYSKNVHINRIKDPEEYTVSERDLSKAQNSRKDFYKDAANLLCKYRRLIRGNYNKTELEELLNETLIMPGDTPTLFELYSVFGVLKKIESEGDENFQLKKIDKGSEEIAVFENEENETKITVYHDSTGNERFFEKLKKLKEKESEVEVEFLERFRKANVEHGELVSNMLDEDKGSIYGGRPDLLIEYYKKGKLNKLLIGEVKYSEGKQVFKKGLKELIEYLYFVRKKENNGKYHLNIKKEKPNLEELKGILIVDNKEFIENKTDETEHQPPFKLEIYDSKNLEDYLKLEEEEEDDL